MRVHVYLALNLCSYAYGPCSSLGAVANAFINTSFSHLLIEVTDGHPRQARDREHLNSCENDVSSIVHSAD